MAEGVVYETRLWLCPSPGEKLVNAWYGMPSTRGMIRGYSQTGCPPECHRHGTRTRRVLATCRADRNDLKGINLQHFKKWSMTTRTGCPVVCGPMCSCSSADTYSLSLSDSHQVLGDPQAPMLSTYQGFIWLNQSRLKQAKCLLRFLVHVGHKTEPFLNLGCI